jgi:hypothetical protein
MNLENKLWDSVTGTVQVSVTNSFWKSIIDSVWDSVTDSVIGSVWNSVGFSTRDTDRDSIDSKLTDYEF